MPRQRLSPVWRTDTPCRGPREEGPGGEGTYEIGAGENLASAQYLLLWWFICVLWLDEAGRAAGVLTVLQRRGVTFINAVQRATSHTPVKVVHALPLQVEREKCNMRGEKQWATLSFMLLVNKIIEKENKNRLNYTIHNTHNHRAKWGDENDTSMTIQMYVSSTSKCPDHRVKIISLLFICFKGANNYS